MCIRDRRPHPTGVEHVAERSTGRVIGDERIAGVAELMNFPGVFLGMKSELAKIEASGGAVANVAYMKAELVNANDLVNQVTRASAGLGKGDATVILPETSPCAHS